MWRKVLLFVTLLVLAVVAAWRYSGMSQSEQVAQISDPFTQTFLLQTNFRSALFTGSGAETISGELPREIARQGFLIAARDE